MTIRTVFTLALAAALLCSCDSTTSSSTAATQPSESESSKAFFAAVEKGDYEAGVAILQDASSKPNPPAIVLYNWVWRMKRAKESSKTFKQQQGSINKPPSLVIQMLSTISPSFTQMAAA